MARSVPLNVNGQAAAVEVDDPDMPLLYALRDNLGLHGPRFGCAWATVFWPRMMSLARFRARMLVSSRSQRAVNSPRVRFATTLP